jgi:CRP-like cAMP-binding protein
MVDRLVEVARRLRTLRRPSEAAELLEIAAALSPQRAALREEAGRLRSEVGVEDFDREFKRRNLEASHALGMAHIFETRGEFSRAVDMIDLAKLRTPFNYLAYAAAGFLHMRHGDAEAALPEFIQARRLNPLDFRLTVETSRAALENAMDALLLANWRSEREQQQERRRVETLIRLCHREPEEMEALLAARTKVLQKACDHVALSHARIFSSTDLSIVREAAGEITKVNDNLLRQATELRSMSLFHHFNDDQLISLTKLMTPMSFEQGEVVFRETEDSRDLYLVRQGTIHIARTTPAGSQILTTLGAGSLFGEVSYLDGFSRSATAFGVGNGSLFNISAEALDEAVDADRELAVSLLWGFWQTLASKVRSASICPSRTRWRSSANRVCRPKSCASSQNTLEKRATRPTPWSLRRVSAATAYTLSWTAPSASPGWFPGWVRSVCPCSLEARSSARWR